MRGKLPTHVMLRTCQFVKFTPGKINGWNLRIHPTYKGETSSIHHHDFRFDSLILGGCREVFKDVETLVITIAKFDSCGLTKLAG